MLKHLQWSCSLSSGPLGRKEYWLKLMRPQKWVREAELTALLCLLQETSGGREGGSCPSRASLTLLPRAGQIVAPSHRVGSKFISLAVPWTRGRAEERSWWAAEAERAATPKTASPAGGWHHPKTRRESNRGQEGPEHPELTESQAMHAESPCQK